MCIIENLGIGPGNEAIAGYLIIQCYMTQFRRDFELACYTAVLGIGLTWLGGEGRG